MNFLESRIVKILLDQGLLDQFQYQSVRDHQIRHGGVFHLLVAELGLVPEAMVCEVVANATGLSTVSLAKMRPDREALSKLPGSFCRERAVYPCAVRDNATTLWLAMADPTDGRTRTEAQVLSGLKIRQLVAPPSEIQAALARDFGESTIVAGPTSEASGDIQESEFDLGEEEEFKVTDLSGTTAVRHLHESQGSTESSPQGTADQRLYWLLQGQEKLDRLLGNLLELFVEKGLIAAEDFQNRLRK